MNNKWFWRIGSVVALLLFVVSCKKKYDFDNIELQDNYEAEWGAPLFDFSSTLKDYYTTYLDSIKIDDGTAEIRIENDGLFHFMYETKVDLGTAEENFIIDSPLPVLDINNDFSSIPEDKWPNGLNEGTVPNQYDGVSSQVGVDTLYYLLDNAGFNNAELVRAEFKSGTVTVNISSTYQHNIKTEYEIVSFSKSGNTSFGKGTVNLTPSNLQQTQNFDMTNAVVNLNSPKGINRLMVIVKSQFTLIGGNNLSKSDKVDATFTATNLKWRVVEGKVDFFDISSASDTIKVDVLDESVQDIENNLVIYDPRLAINFLNTGGVPVSANITSFEVQKRDGSRTPLNLNETSVKIPADAVNDVNDLSTPASKDYVIDKTNSNIDEVLKGGATHLIYDTELKGGDISEPRLWLRDTSRLVLKPSVDIPFTFSISKYEFTDTVDCMLCGEDSITDATLDFELKMIIENGLPIDMSVQCFFLDTTFNSILAPLFVDESKLPTVVLSPLVVPAAPTDANGKVTGVTTSVRTITLKSSLYNALKETNFKYVATGITAKGGNKQVKLHATDQFNIRAGGKLKVKADLSEQ